MRILPPVPRLAAAVVLLFALTPGAASAATVGGRTHWSEATRLGTMHYRSGHGVANRVTVKPVSDYDELMVVERAERLRATGECRQVGSHRAICPWSESGVAIKVVVGSRTDHVKVAGKVSARVRGGGGADVLKGNGDELFGDRGADVLLGGRDMDLVHGGPGRDRMEGHGGGDTFFDDEADAQAARDVVVGGRRGAGATVSYAERARGLRLDVRRSRLGPERDRVSGVTGLTGGSGDDVLIGDGAWNWLDGGPGEDRLYGRAAADVLAGGRGDDLLRGGGGADTLWESMTRATGAFGADRFVGGAGADSAQALDRRPDEVRCDAADDPVKSDPRDRLRGCRRIEGWDVAELEMWVQPRLTADAAIFTLRCGATELEEDPASGSTDVWRCRGRLTVRGSDGELFGTRTFAFVVEGERTPWVTVAVPLSAAGRDAIRRGTVVRVTARALSLNGWKRPTAGYRAFVRG